MWIHFIKQKIRLYHNYGCPSCTFQSKCNKIMPQCPTLVINLPLALIPPYKGALRFTLTIMWQTREILFLLCLFLFFSQFTFVCSFISTIKGTCRVAKTEICKSTKVHWSCWSFTEYKGTFSFKTLLSITCWPWHCINNRQTQHRGFVWKNVFYTWYTTQLKHCHWISVSLSLVYIIRFFLLNKLQFYGIGNWSF